MKTKAAALLRLSPQELASNRRLQGAIHAYLAERRGRDAKSEALRSARAIEPAFLDYILVEKKYLTHLFATKSREHALFYYGWIELEDDGEHIYYFPEWWLMKPQALLREEDLVPRIQWGETTIPFAKPLLRVGVNMNSPEEELNMHSGLWRPTGLVQGGFVEKPELNSPS